MKSFITLVTLYLSISLLSGCATITRGSTEALVVESDPAGANVSLSNGMKGKTPTSFEVRRKEPLVATISKPGYETATVKLTSQMSKNGGMAMAGNIVFGGLVGAAVDTGTGAGKELKPNPLQVELNPL